VNKKTYPEQMLEKLREIILQEIVMGNILPGQKRVRLRKIKPKGRVKKDPGKREESVELEEEESHRQEITTKRMFNRKLLSIRIRRMMKKIRRLL